MSGEELHLSAEGDLVEEIKGWASLWGDLLLVEMTLHHRSKLPDNATNLFTRRALWEEAVTAYWRTANTGRRQQRVTELITQLGTNAKECHEEVEAWRNHHVAHRVDELREGVSVNVIVDPDTGKPSRTDVQVAPVLGPEQEGSDLARRFQDHVVALKNQIWQQRIFPLEQKILGEYSSRGDDLRKSATPPDSSRPHFAINIHPSGKEVEKLP